MIICVPRSEKTAIIVTGCFLVLTNFAQLLILIMRCTNLLSKSPTDSPFVDRKKHFLEKALDLLFLFVISCNFLCKRIINL